MKLNSRDFQYLQSPQNLTSLASRDQMISFLNMLTSTSFLFSIYMWNVIRSSLGGMRLKFLENVSVLTLFLIISVCSSLFLRNNLCFLRKVGGKVDHKRSVSFVVKFTRVLYWFWLKRTPWKNSDDYCCLSRVLIPPLVSVNHWVIDRKHTFLMDPKNEPPKATSKLWVN